MDAAGVCVTAGEQTQKKGKKKIKMGFFFFFKTRALQLSFASFYLTTVNNLHVSSSNGCRESARTTPSSIKL